ncbi:MAG: hypothetical protein ACJA2N_000063 [Salibacteraceae bacterium]|jgi:hypothetical protein
MIAEGKFGVKKHASVIVFEPQFRKMSLSIK